MMLWSIISNYQRRNNHIDPKTASKVEKRLINTIKIGIYLIQNHHFDRMHSPVGHNTETSSITLTIYPPADPTRIPIVKTIRNDLRHVAKRATHDIQLLIKLSDSMALFSEKNILTPMILAIYVRFKVQKI